MTAPQPDLKPQTVIKPVDDIIQAGFAQKMTQQFRAAAIFVTSPDALPNLKAQLGNKQPDYPYVFLYITSFSPNTDSYQARRLAFHGIPVTLNSDNLQMQNARIIPTNFEVEVTYVSNRYDGLDTKSVKGFVRRWLTTRRNGALSFNADYGLSTLSISSTMSDSLNIPKRDNPADTEPVYSVTANITIHGYVSEPALNTKSRINQIVLAEAPTLLAGQQFFPF